MKFVVSMKLNLRLLCLFQLHTRRKKIKQKLQQNELHGSQEVHKPVSCSMGGQTGHRKVMPTFEAWSAK